MSDPNAPDDGQQGPSDFTEVRKARAQKYTSLDGILKSRLNRVDPYSKLGSKKKLSAVGHSFDEEIINAIDDEYDPYAHRDDVGESLASDTESIANLVKSSFGTGLFLMPKCFSYVGIVNGLIGTVFVGMIVSYSLQLLVKNHYKMCKAHLRPVLTYPEVFSLVISESGPRIKKISKCSICYLDITLLISFIGLGAIYVLFVASTLKEIVDEEGILEGKWYVAIMAPFCLALNFIRDLKKMAPLSVVANVLLVSTLIIVLLYAFKDGIGDHETVYVSTKIEDYPQFMGTVIFSLCSPGMVLTIERSMKNPQHYPGYCGILNQGLTFIITSHLIVGLAGYLKWGTESKPNICDNLPNDQISGIGRFMLMISILLSYGLCCYMPINIICYDYLIPMFDNFICCSADDIVFDTITRVFVTFLTCILAAIVPRLDLFNSLVGALCMATLATIFPAIMEIILSRDDYGKRYWRLILAIVILITGVFAMVCAGLTSIVLIISFFVTGN